MVPPGGLLKAFRAFGLGRLNPWVLGKAQIVVACKVECPMGRDAAVAPALLALALIAGCR